MSEEGVERRLTTILAADVVGYSRLMAADEAGTLAQLKTHRKELIEPKTAEHHGRVVKLMGDGTLMEFGSVVDAVRFAVDVQQAMAERNAKVPEDRRITYRIGINIGDIIVEGEDIYGDGVNVAARLEGLADPGGICVSRTVFNHVKGKVDLGFEDLGEQEVKNIPEPVRVYRWTNATADPIPSVTAAEEPLPLPDKPSIAVLPFTNMSGDPEQEYFSDGITEDIITDLSKMSGLFVIARNSAFAYKDKTVRVQQVGRELGVRYILEGSVRKAGGRVRITAQLVDGTTGGHLWADRYDRDLSDIFAVQDEVTRQIVSNLAIKLTRDEERRLTREATDNLEAYDQYLRAADLLWRSTKDTTVEARRLLQQAIDLDPQLTLAYVILSHTHLMDYINRWSDSPEDSLELAHQLALQAVALEEDEPDAHWELGLTYLWLKQHDQAITALQRAAALNPNLANAHASLGRV